LRPILLACREGIRGIFRISQKRDTGARYIKEVAGKPVAKRGHRPRSTENNRSLENTVAGGENDE